MLRTQRLLFRFSVRLRQDLARPTRQLSTDVAPLPDMYRDPRNRFNYIVQKIHNYSRRLGKMSRPDGYLDVEDVIRRFPKPERNTTYDRWCEGAEMTMHRFITMAKECNQSLSLLHQPELHCIGLTEEERPFKWWVRPTEQADFPRYGIDQIFNRIMPGTKVRNAIFQATKGQWEHIRKEGLKRPEGGLIFMDPIDRINEERGYGDAPTVYVYVFIDMEAAMKGGCEFFLTRLLKVASPGNEKGFIPTEYIKDAVEVTVHREMYQPSQPLPPLWFRRKFQNGRGRRRTDEKPVGKPVSSPVSEIEITQ